MKNKVFISILVCIFSIQAEQIKAPRPNGESLTGNAIAGKQSDGCCGPVLELLQKIYKKLKCDEEQNTILAEQTLLEIQQQNELLSQQLGFDSISLAQQEELINTLQETALNTEDESLQLLVTILAQLLTQQQEIETIQQELETNFQDLEGQVDSIITQLAAQQALLQQIDANVTSLLP